MTLRGKGSFGVSFTVEGGDRTHRKSSCVLERPLIANGRLVFRTGIFPLTVDNSYRDPYSCGCLGLGTGGLDVGSSLLWSGCLVSFCRTILNTIPLCIEDSLISPGPPPVVFCKGLPPLLSLDGRFLSSHSHVLPYAVDRSIES